MKTLLLLTLTLFFFNAYAVEVAEETDLISCAVANGNLSHALYKNKEGFSARIAFPKLTNKDGKLMPNIPLSNENVFSSNLEFLKRKTEIFTAIFKDINYLALQFGEDQCQNIQNDDHSVWWCGNKTPQTLGGVKFSNIEFSMENQTRKNIAGEVEAYYGFLMVQTPHNESGISVKYSTSFTYYPKDSETVCSYSL